MPIRELKADEAAKRRSAGKARELTPEQAAQRRAGAIGMPGAAQFNAEQAAKAEDQNTEPRRGYSNNLYKGPTGPGLPASYLRGLSVEGPAELAGGLGSATDALVGLGARAGLPGAQAVGDLGAGEAFGSGTRGALQRAIPIQPPVSPGEKTAQSAGVGTFFGLAGAPIAAAGGIPLAVGEVGLATLGGAAGEELRQGAEQGGAGEGMQAVAQGAGDVLLSASPMAVVARAPKIANAAARIVRSMKPSAEAMAAAERMGVSIRDLHKAAGELKTFVPEHASGDERYVADWIRYLEEGIPRFTDDAMPTTRQIIEARRDAGASLASLEEGLGRKSKGFSGRVAGRRQAAEDQLRSEFDRLRGRNVDTRNAPSAFEAVSDMAWNAQRQMWDLVPPDQLPRIPTAGLKQGAQEAVARAGRFEQDIPEEAQTILELGDDISWDEYQSIRSRLLKSQRIGNRATAETMAQLKTDNRAPIIQAFQRELDQLVNKTGDAGDAYGNALRATANFYERFDPKSVVTRSFEDLTEPAKIAARIVGSKRPAEEVNRAMRVFAQQPNGVETFQRMLYDHIIGPGELNPGTAKQALKSLRANEAAARAAWGDDGFANMIDLVERARIVSVGKTGKSAQAMSVGSGGSDTGTMMAPVRAFWNPSGAATDIAMNQIQKSLGKNTVNSAILREAALDPKMAALLLKMPEPRAVEAWIINWKKLTARAAARVALKEAGKE